jgi:O-antigen ligase
MPSVDRSALPSSQFWALILALAALFFMGGSSRGDVQSLVILNPLIIVFCALAAMTLKVHNLQERKWSLIGFGLIFLLIGLYSLPLPREFGTLSIATDKMREISADADVLDTVPVMAIAPNQAMQSFFALFAPLAVFLFAIQLKRDELQYALPVIIVLGAISGFIGVLQLAGSPNGPLYFYRITNNGSAVGLFANRNHAAVFLACLFPMLSVFSSKSIFGKPRSIRTQQAIAGVIAVILVPLILVTGSRSGLLAAFVGLIGSFLLYYRQFAIGRKPQGNQALLPIVAVVLLVCLIFLTIYFSRATAIERIFADPAGTTARSDFWKSSLSLFWEYFPFGFGPGAFAPAFQKEEALALLNSTYLNRLHNDWLEAVLTFGVPGSILLVCCLAYYIWRTVTLWLRMDGNRTGVALGRMGSIIIAILAIASLSDYPLRTPAMMGLLALVVMWFIHAGQSPKDICQKSPLSQSI